MKIQTLPKETLAELLYFLADQETFSTADAVLRGGIDLSTLRAALRELAKGLKQEAKEEKGKVGMPDYRHHAFLSDEARQVISCLTPSEERVLFRSFGLLDD